MNAAAIGAGPAAARMRAKRRIISHFMSRNAISADAAVGYDQGRLIERRMFARLQDKGVIVSARNQTYYLDIPKYDDYQRGARKRAGLAIAAAFTAIVAGVGIGLLG